MVQMFIQKSYLLHDCKSAPLCIHIFCPSNNVFFILHAGIVFNSKNIDVFKAMLNQGPMKDLLNFDYDSVYDKFDEYTFGKSSM